MYHSTLIRGDVRKPIRCCGRLQHLGREDSVLTSSWIGPRRLPVDSYRCERCGHYLTAVGSMLQRDEGVAPARRMAAR